MLKWCVLKGLLRGCVFEGVWEGVLRGCVERIYVESVCMVWRG